ncbi:MAG: DUF1573 domain-containing protein [Planctomycetes bacterium]|nr:DUF1573 domain-containing protein [Planctomycetota bacterium]
MIRSLTLLAGVLLVAGLVVWARGSLSTADSAAGRAKVATQAPSTDVAAAKAPRVVPVANVHQFGIMNPGDRRTHKFTVRNDGDAPLTLKLASTTCKCTLADLEKAEIPAGGQTEIELAWHVENPQYRFRQAALIDTNDPAMPQFELAVEGSVRVKFATAPDSVIFADVPRDEPRRLQMIAFSQAYPEIRIEKIESDLPGVVGEISTYEHDNLKVDHARWSRDMVVERRPDGRSGSFEGKLRIHYVGRTPDGTEEPGVHEVPVYGETVGDVTLHGRNVVGKLLMLGQVSRLQGKQTRMYVHFRNAPNDLKAELFQAEPSFLQVTVGKPERLTPALVRVPVDVAVPPGVEPVNFSRDDALGYVGLKTNVPDAAKVWIQTSLVVEP